MVCVTNSKCAIYIESPRLILAVDYQFSTNLAPLVTPLGLCLLISLSLSRSLAWQQQHYTLLFPLLHFALSSKPTTQRMRALYPPRYILVLHIIHSFKPSNSLLLLSSSFFFFVLLFYFFTPTIEHLFAPLRKITDNRFECVNLLFVYFFRV